MKNFLQFPKYLLGLLVVTILRLTPHPPNVEPIMASMMPYSKKFGWFSGFLFCLLAVLGYDFFSGTLGSWSLITASTYAFLGVIAGFYFKNKSNKIHHYVIYAIFATIFFDLITGVGMGVFMFHQSFVTTLVGQIPFTFNHLLGNIVFSATISPALYRWILSNPKLEMSKFLKSETIIS